MFWSFVGSDLEVSLRYAQREQRQNVEERCYELEKKAFDDRMMHRRLLIQTKQRARSFDLFIPMIFWRWQ